MEVKEVKTKEGFTAWLVEDHSLPLLSLKITFRDAGTASDPAGKEGRAALAAQLLMQGAGEYDALAFQKALDDKAIRMDFDVGDDMLSAELATISEHRLAAFRLLGLALSAPRFDEAAMARKRDQRLSDIARYAEDPAYNADKAWRAVAFGTHPYGRPALGLAESIATLKRDDFTHYRSHYLTRGNILISAAGDIAPNELADALDAMLKTLPAEFAPDGKIGEAALNHPGETIRMEKNIPQTYVTFGVPAMKRTDPDFYAAYMVNYLLGGGSLTSLLAEEIREKRGLAYYAYSDIENKLYNSTLVGHFGTRNDQADEAVKVMKQALAGLAAKGATESELAAAKEYVTGSFVLRLDNNASVADHLTAMQFYALGRDYLTKRNDYMNQVTPDDVRRLARQLLDPEKLLVVALGGVPEQAKKPAP